MMKVVKIIIGIISIILTIIVFFQSCAVTIKDVLADEGGTGDGTIGIIAAIFMLLAGIIATTAWNSRGGSIACTFFYTLAGIFTVTLQGDSEPKVWGAVCFGFAAFFLMDAIIFNNKNSKKDNRAPSVKI